MTLGEKLSKLRKERGYTQEELADLLHVSRQAVSKWESDAAYPETDKLIQLGKLYDCSMDYLLKDVPDVTNADETPANDLTDALTQSACDEKRKADKKRRAAVLSAIEGVSVLSVVISYLAIGFLCDAWHPGWLLFFLIPTLVTLAEAIAKGKPSHFAYPVPVTALFLLLGFLCDAWHPAWLLFLTIPVYYLIADALQRK